MLSGLVVALRGDASTAVPLVGVEITATGTAEATGAAVSQRALADATGAFSFSLPAGTYTLLEAQPSNYLAGFATVGSAGGATKGANTIGGIRLAAGQVATGYAFTEVAPASLAGTVYHDANANGVK